jgi:hypothetical protein
MMREYTDAVLAINRIKTKWEFKNYWMR